MLRASVRGFLWIILLSCCGAAASTADTLDEERQNLSVTIDMYADITSYVTGLAAYRDVCVDRKPEIAQQLLEAYAAWELRSSPRAEELGDLFWSKVAHLVRIDPADKVGARRLTRDVIQAKLVQQGNAVRANLRKESESNVSDTCMRLYDGLRSDQLDLDRRKETEINTFMIFSEVPK